MNGEGEANIPERVRENIHSNQSELWLVPAFHLVLEYTEKEFSGHISATFAHHLDHSSDFLPCDFVRIRKNKIKLS